MILGFVLGPLMEENLRRAMLISRGDPLVFVTRPISAVFVLLTLLLIATFVLPTLRPASKTAWKVADVGAADTD